MLAGSNSLDSWPNGADETVATGPSLSVAIPATTSEPASDHVAAERAWGDTPVLRGGDQHSAGAEVEDGGSGRSLGPGDEPAGAAPGRPRRPASLAW